MSFETGEALSSVDETNVQCGRVVKQHGLNQASLCFGDFRTSLGSRALAST